jgi:hypothetical protein
VAVTSQLPETATSFNANWGEMRLGLPHHLLREALLTFVGALLKIAATEWQKNSR